MTYIKGQKVYFIIRGQDNGRDAQRIHVAEGFVAENDTGKKMIRVSLQRAGKSPIVKDCLKASLRTERPCESSL